jgi:radical SAM superfamily enzyme YgiQ (UPF0313 family)
MRVLLIVYDNDAFLHWFPQGLAYIAAVLRQAGVEVEIYNQDMHHYPDEHLTQHLDNNNYDWIGVSVIAGYYQYRKLLKISEAINRAKRRPLYVLGGHGPAPEPVFFMQQTQADVIVRGEGEITVVELVQAIQGERSWSDVQGIAWRDGNRIRINTERPLVTDIDTLPFPAYDLFPMSYYRLLRMPHSRNRDFVMPVLSGRGCTFKCTFCYRMDKGFRPRATESLVEEIKLLRKDYGINYIAFSDELLVSSIPRVMELCDAFIQADLDIRWTCNGRLNYARPAVLKRMKEAGCAFINYGIEAMDDQVLKNMKKGLTTRQVEEGIQATLDAGISPGYNIIFGNVGDNRETLQKGVDFLLKYDDGAQMRTIRPVTPYPGSPLYYEAIQRGLLKDCKDFYENKHTNSDLLAINFTELDDDQFHAALFEANRTLLENYFQHKVTDAVEQARRLYFDHDAEFRGFRQT